MAENTVNLTKNIIPHQSVGDILLIDHDAVSVASLTPMLKERSHKDVMRVNGVSEAISVINAAEKRENIVEECMKQMEAFRDNIKRQIRTSRSSLLGRRPLNKTFTYSEMYQKGKSIAKVERRNKLWTHDRHKRFLAAISILGEKKSRPKAILEIMKDSNLSQRQVASHLQKYKCQVERISNTLMMNEWKSMDKTAEYPSGYVYPCKASSLTKNLNERNSMRYSPRKKKYSSSSTVQYSFKRSAADMKDKMPNFHLGETSGLHRHPLSGSSVGASNIDAFQKESAEICISQSNPNPSSSVLKTNRNQIDSGSLEKNHGLSQDMIFNGAKSNHLGLVSGETSHETPHETDTNQMDWDLLFSEEAYAILEDMTVSETNRTQVGLVPGDTSSTALDNVAPPENNTNEMGLVPYQEGNDIPIEDLISFDTDINDMDLDAWLENFDLSQVDVPLPASCIGHDLAFTPKTSQHQSTEATSPREAIEGGNHLDDDWCEGQEKI